VICGQVDFRLSIEATSLGLVCGGELGASTILIKAETLVKEFLHQASLDFAHNNLNEDPCVLVFIIE
jgi:hypothetical protein